MESKSSPYMLLFRNSDTIYAELSAEQRQKLMEQWNAWFDGLAARGKVQHGHPLESQGRVISRGRVTDGPFAEANEAVGGYFFLTVSGMEEATEIALQCPGIPHGITVEIRPVADMCAELGVRGRSAAAAKA